MKEKIRKWFERGGGWDAIICLLYAYVATGLVYAALVVFFKFIK